MKNRVLTLAFIACLAGSLGFADNPADAPLVPNDGNTTFTKQQTRKDRNCQRQNNKDESASSKRKQKNGRREQHDAQSSLDGQPGQSRVPQ